MAAGVPAPLLFGLLALACVGAALFLARGMRGNREYEVRLREVMRAPETLARSERERGRGIRRAEVAATPLARFLARLGRSPHIPANQRVPVLILIVVAGGSTVLAGYVGTIVVAALAGPVVGVVVGLLVLRGLYSWERQRYQTRIFNQIPEAMGLILRAIRAGLPVAEALANVAREISSPSREEFEQVVGALSIGQPVEASLIRLANRTGITEYAFFAVTIGLQASTGGNLGETLENLSEMVRKRVAMVGRVKAMTAEARMSAIILTSLPFATAGAITVMTPNYLVPLFTTPGGFQLLLIGLSMMVAGVMVIRMLLRSAVKD